MKKHLVFAVTALVSIFAFAEGSKNLTPGSNPAALTNAANNKAGHLLVTTDVVPTTSIYGRFMRPSSSAGWTPSSRLYVYLKNGETVFYGLRNWVKTGNSATGNNNEWTNGRGTLTVNFFYDNAQTNNFTSTITDPVTPYATATWNSSDTIGTIPQGTIVDYDQAAIGPLQVFGTGGYNARSFTNNTGADRGFWIVIPTNLATMTYSFDLWDFTVVSGTTGNYTEQQGRLYSELWSFDATSGGLVSSDFQMYVPILKTGTTNEYYVKSVDFSGMRPWFFNISANADGTGTSSTYDVNRKSTNAFNSNPEFLVFVNNPDITIVPTATVPVSQVVVSQYSYCTSSGVTSVISVYVDNAANVAVLIDLNNNGTYETSDVFFSEYYATAGNYQILWDGKDGNGVPVQNGTSITLTTRVGFSPIHVPMWDVEGNAAGIAMSDIRPINSGFNNTIFWDNQNLTNWSATPLLNVLGTVGKGNTWPYDEGNEKTVNTWAFGYVDEKNTVLTFEVVCDQDIDFDDDGIPNTVEGYKIGNTYYSALGDVDADGLANYIDTDNGANPLVFVDSNNDGLSDFFDADLDGVPNFKDLDSDNDGITDLIEIGGVDIDGNGVADNLADTDGDGLANIFDNDLIDGPTGSSPCAPFPACAQTSSTSKLFDANNDKTLEKLHDFDGDGYPNYIDADSDNDGVADVVESGGADANQDGKIDGYADLNNNGFIDANDAFCAQFTPAIISAANATAQTNTGVGSAANAVGAVNGTYADVNNSADLLNLQIAHEPIDNEVTLTYRLDGNGTAAFSVLVSTNGTTYSSVGVNPNTVSANTGTAVQNLVINVGNPNVRYIRIDPSDTDPDIEIDAISYNYISTPANCISVGVPKLFTGADANVDGKPDTYPALLDKDADLHPNYLDLDADKDGIADIVENNGIDIDFDGQIDYPVPGHPETMVDANKNGMTDNLEPALSGTALVIANADADNKPNYLDIDSDNDGIVDNVESQATSLHHSPLNVDVDADGIDDAYDVFNNLTLSIMAGGQYITPVNKDAANDLLPDYIDLDTDNDGKPDALEAWDSNADGTAEYLASGNDADNDGLDDSFDTDFLPSHPAPQLAAIAANTNPVQMYGYSGLGDEPNWRDGNIYVFVKVFLEGPYDVSTHQMTTALSAGGATSILATNALVQPYGTAPWPTAQQYLGTENVAPSFFATHTDIVDWVIIELRDKTNSSSVLFRRAAFVKADGTVVELDGSYGIRCEGLEADDYFVSVRHRNHLGVMKAATIYLDAEPLLNEVDFTSTSTALYGTNAAIEIEPGKVALHMGNALPDNTISFTGSNNDKAAIGVKVNSSVSLVNTFVGYAYEDIDLNGVTAFTGSGNDKAKLGIKLSTSVNLLNTFTEQLP